MRSLKTFPELKVVAATDLNRARVATFCAHWKIRAAQSLQEMLDGAAQTYQVSF